MTKISCFLIWYVIFASESSDEWMIKDIERVVGEEECKRGTGIDSVEKRQVSRGAEKSM